MLIDIIKMIFCIRNFKERGGDMTKNKRIISVFLAFSIIFVMSFSAVYIASEASHECPGEECPICVHIDICKSVFTVLKFFVAVLLIFKAILRFIISVSEKTAFFTEAVTLVSLKVKLSD